MASVMIQTNDKNCYETFRWIVNIYDVKFLDYIFSAMFNHALAFVSRFDTFCIKLSYIPTDFLTYYNATLKAMLFCLIVIKQHSSHMPNTWGAQLPHTKHIHCYFIPYSLNVMIACKLIM